MGKESGYYWTELGADPPIVAHYDHTRDQWRSLEWAIPGWESVRVLSSRLLPPNH